MTSIPRKTPVDGLQEDWLYMHEEVERAREEQRRAEELSVQLATERDILVENLDRATAELGFWRAYAIQIETRLDVVQSVISESRNEARQHARSKMNEAVQEQQQSHEPEQEEARQIVDGIVRANPHNGALTNSWPQ